MEGGESVLMGSGYGSFFWVHAVAREPRSGQLYVVPIHVVLLLVRRIRSNKAEKAGEVRVKSLLN